MARKPREHDRRATVVTTGPQAGKARAGSRVNQGVRYDEMPTPQASAGLMHATAQMANLTNETQKKVTVIVDRNGTIVDLTKTDALSNLDLSGYDLSNLNWSLVKELNNVNLEGALIGNSPYRFVANNSNFDGVVFEGGYFSNAKFIECSMKNVSINNVSGENAHDYGYGQDNVSFIETDLTNVSISNSKMRAYFCDSNMQGSKIRGSNISMGTIRLNASGSDWRDSKLKIANRDREGGCINLSGTTIKDCEIRDSSIILWNDVEERGFFRKKVVDRKNAPGLLLENVHMRESQIDFSNLSDSQIRSCRLEKVAIGDCRMDGMDLSGNVFRECTFKRVRANGADFTNTNFKNSEFGINDDRSYLTNCNFSGAFFDGVTLGNTDVKGSNWVGARTDKMEIFPDAQPVEVLTGPDPSDTQDQSGNSYEQYSINEFIARTGQDKDYVTVMAWAGDIELRNNYTKLRFGERDDASHFHIPVWSFQNAVASTSKPPPPPS